MVSKLSYLWGGTGFIAKDLRMVVMVVRPRRYLWGAGSFFGEGEVWICFSQEGRVRWSSHGAGKTREILYR